MIVFKQKEYSEYEAMRTLYSEIMRYGGQRGMWEIINKSQLVPVLKGNSVVIEKFVISTSLFGRDKYRMYIKIGAKAKLPDQVRLKGWYYDDRLGNLSLRVKGGVPFPNKPQQNNFSEVASEKIFGDKKKNNNGGKFVDSGFDFKTDIQMSAHHLLGEAIKYDKGTRELVLEFDTVQDAIQALQILPFGLNYKIYLLDA